MIQDAHKRLMIVTHGCRPDMHEPDEQGISAQIVGDHLDNACGNHVCDDAIANKYQEYVVIIDRNDRKEAFNLATLIALARMANVTDTEQALIASLEGMLDSHGLLERHLDTLDGKINEKALYHFKELMKAFFCHEPNKARKALQKAKG